MKLKTIIRKKTGLTIPQFCEKKLNVEYKAFMARLYQRKLYPSEVLLIVIETGASVERLFGASFEDLIFYNNTGGPSARKLKKLMKDPTVAEAAYRSMGLAKLPADASLNDGELYITD